MPVHADKNNHVGNGDADGVGVGVGVGVAVGVGDGHIHGAVSQIFSVNALKSTVVTGVPALN